MNEENNKFSDSQAIPNRLVIAIASLTLALISILINRLAIDNVPFGTVNLFGHPVPATIIMSVLTAMGSMLLLNIYYVKKFKSKINSNILFILIATLLTSIVYVMEYQVFAEDTYGLIYIFGSFPVPITVLVSAGIAFTQYILVAEVSDLLINR